MDKRTLGQNLEVSALGLGGMGMSSTTGRARSSGSWARCTLPTSFAVRPATACSCCRTLFSSTSR